MSTTFTTQELALPGVLRIAPEWYEDERGFAVTAYSAQAFADLGLPVFVEDFVSQSKKSVLRGMHFQTGEFAQNKLMRCAQGKVFEVVVDHDRTSPTFGQHIEIELSDADQAMLYIPKKYAHGFVVLSDKALVEYKLDAVHRPDSSGGVRWNDPAFSIPWPVQDPILSTKDAAWPFIGEAHE